MDLIEWVELGHTYNSCLLKVRSRLKVRDQTKNNEARSSNLEYSGIMTVKGLIWRIQYRSCRESASALS